MLLWRCGDVALCTHCSDSVLSRSHFLSRCLVLHFRSLTAKSTLPLARLHSVTLKYSRWLLLMVLFPTTVPVSLLLLCKVWGNGCGMGFASGFAISSPNFSFYVSDTRKEATLWKRKPAAPWANPPSHSDTWSHLCSLQGLCFFIPRSLSPPRADVKGSPPRLASMAHLRLCACLGPH